MTYEIDRYGHITILDGTVNMKVNDEGDLINIYVAGNWIILEPHELEAISEAWEEFKREIL